MLWGRGRRTLRPLFVQPAQHGDGMTPCNGAVRCVCHATACTPHLVHARRSVPEHEAVQAGGRRGLRESFWADLGPPFLLP